MTSEVITEARFGLSGPNNLLEPILKSSSRNFTNWHLKAKASSLKGINKGQIRTQQPR